MQPNKSGQDIAKPGSTPADATSRPLIVTKSAMIKDPMVQTDDAVSSQEVVVAPPSASKKTIEPLTSQEKTDTAADSEVKESSDTPDESSDASSTADTMVVEGDSATKEQDDAGKRQAIADELIQQKKYFVPIGAETRRRAGRRLIVVLLLIAVTSIAAVLAIDAGIIATNLQLPFDFIK